MMVNDIPRQLWEHPVVILIIAVHENLQIVEREVKGMHVVLGREVKKCQEELDPGLGVRKLE